MRKPEVGMLAGFWNDSGKPSFETLFIGHGHWTPVFWGRKDSLLVRLQASIVKICSFTWTSCFHVPWSHVCSLLYAIHSPVCLLLSAGLYVSFYPSGPCEQILELRKRLWNGPRLATLLVYVVMFLQSDCKRLKCKNCLLYFSGSSWHMVNAQ